MAVELNKVHYHIIIPSWFIQNQREGAPLVDVDGSYIYKKSKALAEAGKQFAPLSQDGEL